MSRILIVDDQPLLCRALKAQVEQLGHEVLALASCGSQALAMARELRPDLIILELAIPQHGGLELVRRLRTHDEQLKIVVFSGQNVRQFAPRCQALGASGFVSKQDQPAELNLAISAALHGRSYFPRVLETGGEAQPDELGQLSARELTVLHHLAQGYSNQQIADELVLSFKTVSTYKTRLLEKLHASSLVELVEIAQRNGLSRPDSHGVDLAPAPSEWANELDRLRPLVDDSPYAMFVRDREGRLLLCNQRFLDFYQTTPERVEGTRFAEAGWFTPELGARVQQRYLGLIEQEASFSGDGWVQIFGQKRLMHAWLFPFRNAQGQVLGMLGGLVDLSERELLVQALRNAKEHAEARHRHDVELLRSLAADLQSGLDLLPSATSALPLVRLVERMALVADIAAGGVTLSPSPCVPSDLVRQGIAAWRAMGEYPDIQVDLSCQSSIPAVWMDEEHFLHLVDALLSCTARQSPKGSILISLQGEEAPAAIVKLALQVSSPLAAPSGRRRGLQGIERRLVEQLTTLLAGHYSAESGQLVNLSLPLATPR
ncbi:response regulator [Pseudomonas sp. BN515]|uniref:response regulator n=1 Tax=Pseudomonas sp. BN515 TaxID=2567892 RepID=UPI002455999D|nr:response regulator [Pseudomonas sp. BN515]MDH4873381.1 response regulator [Pseudomonas sp. BN515]